MKIVTIVSSFLVYLHIKEHSILFQMLPINKKKYMTMTILYLSIQTHFQIIFCIIEIFVKYISIPVHINLYICLYMSIFSYQVQFLLQI